MRYGGMTLDEVKRNISEMGAPKARSVTLDLIAELLTLQTRRTDLEELLKQVLALKECNCKSINFGNCDCGLVAIRRQITDLGITPTEKSNERAS